MKYLYKEKKKMEFQFTKDDDSDQVIDNNSIESKEVEKPKGSIDDSEVDIKHVEKTDDDSEYTKFSERDSSIDDDKKEL